MHIALNIFKFFLSAFIGFIVAVFIIHFLFQSLILQNICDNRFFACSQPMYWATLSIAPALLIILVYRMKSLTISEKGGYILGIIYAFILPFGL